MMSKILHIALFLFLCQSMIAQTNFYNKGDLTIVQGASITIKGDYVHQDKGNFVTLIASDGEIDLTGDFINEVDNDVFVTDSLGRAKGLGKVIFNGDTDQSVIGDRSVSFFDLEVNKTGGDLILEQNFPVSNELTLTDGTIFLNGDTIDLGENGVLIDETVDNYIYGRFGVIKSTRTVTGANPNIAGLGLGIDVSAASATLNTVIINRSHDFFAGASNGGILRYYALDIGQSGALLDNVYFNYLDTPELNGLDEDKLGLWTSQNQGNVWDLQSSLTVAALDSVIADNVQIDSSRVIFTLAELACVKVPTVDLGDDTQFLCNTDTTQLDAGNPGLFFLWRADDPSKILLDDSTSQLVTLNEAGIYNVRVTDVNGCVGFDTVEVVIKPYPDFEINTPSSLCLTNESVFEDLTTITEDDFTRLWDFGVSGISSDTSSDQSAMFAYPEDGIYTVNFEVTSDFNCTVDTTFTYIVFPNPTANFDFDNACLNITSDFADASTINDPVTYPITGWSWDFGLIIELSDTSDLQNTSFDYLEAGTYNVRLAVETRTQCVDTIIQAVTIFPRAAVDFDIDSVCIGLTSDLQNITTISSGSLDYTWSFGDGLGSTLDDPTKRYNTTGDFVVQLNALSDLGCEDSIQKVTSIYTLPEAQFTLVEESCAGVELSTTNESISADAVTFLWTWSDQNSSATDPIIQIDDNGVFDVQLLATTENGCQDSIIHELEIFALPELSFTAVDACLGDAVSFSNTSTIASGNISFTWEFSDREGIANSSIRNPNQAYGLEGEHVVTLTGESNESCMAEVMGTIEVFSLPVITLTDVISTCGDQITLNPELIGVTYLWSDNSVADTLIVTNSGSFSLLVTDGNNCSNSQTTEVSLNSTFVPQLTASQSACDLLELDAGNVGSLSYEWFFEDTLTSIAETRKVEVINSGNYIVKITDANGCPGIDSSLVTINISPVLELGNDTSICSLSSVTLESGVTGVTYDWSTGDNTPDITVTDAGVYRLAVTVNNCTTTDSKELFLFDLPQVDLGLTDQVICDSVYLKPSVSFSSYLWSEGSTTDSLLVTNDGVYSLEVTDENDCQNSSQVTVQILSSPVIDLGEDEVICSNATFTLDAGMDNATYLWSNNVTTRINTISASGTYGVSVSVEDLVSSKVCTGYDEVVIAIEPTVQVDLGEDKFLCTGQTTLLDADNTGGTYLWGSNTSFVSQEQEIELGDSGMYWVEVTTVNNCVGRDTVRVFVSEEIVASFFISASLLDVGDTIEFFNLNERDDINFAWDFDDGVTSIAEDPLHSFLTPGTYNVSLTVGNDLCNDEIIKEITVLPLSEVPDIEDGFETFIDFNSTEVYPNPSTGSIRVEIELSTDSEVKLALYNMQGEILEENKLSGKSIQQEYELEGASGVYFLQATAGNQNRTIRLIKND